MLHKKDIISDLNNWRGVALLDIASNVISSIIAGRLSSHFTSLNSEDQCAIPGKGFSDGIFSVKLAVQILHEFDQDIFLLFVDLIKAHNATNRDSLFILLDCARLPSSLIMVIKKLYHNVQIFLNIEGVPKEFSSTCRVIQGNNLAPILFVIFLHFVTKILKPLWNFDTPDFRWFPNSRNNNFRRQLLHCNSKNKGTLFTFTLSSYINDIFYLLLSREDVRNACILIRSHFRRFGLTIHIGSEVKEKKSKTEVVYFPSARSSLSYDVQKNKIYLNDNNDIFVFFCFSFKYLGSLINETISDNLDIKTRVNMASKVFFFLSKQVFRNKLIDIKTRGMMCKVLVLNVLLWGYESWTLTQEHRRQLEAFHHYCLRRILNITIYDVMEQHITNNQVGERTNILPFKNYLELRRSRWLQKIALISESRNPRRLFGAWIEKKRTIGRPQQTIRHAYHTTICKTLGFENSKFLTWMNIARDKNEWNGILKEKLLIS